MTGARTLSHQAPPLDEGGFRAWRSVLVLSRGESRRCRNIHLLHQLVLAGFRDRHSSSAAPADPPDHVLFSAARPQAAPDYRGHRTANAPERILVQSPRHPDWQALIDDGRLTLGQQPFEVFSNYRAGDEIELRVIANPTRCDRTTKRRIPLTCPAECGAWLRRQLDRQGLDIQPADITVSPRERAHGTKDDTTRTIDLRAFRARGIVTDPTLLHQALSTGIGPAKAYGCGLLVTRTTPSQIR